MGETVAELADVTARVFRKLSSVDTYILVPHSEFDPIETLFSSKKDFVVSVTSNVQTYAWSTIFN